MSAADAAWDAFLDVEAAWVCGRADRAAVDAALLAYDAARRMG